MAPYNTDAARWRALVSRDPDSNGHFIYSVKSTRIYCRPVCPGRLARRANVDFYKTALEAERAGFRACKRCKPNTVQEDPQKQAVDKACRLIEAAAKKGDSKALRLRDLAKNVGLTPRYFHKIFKDNTGLTPKDYSDTKRLDHIGLDTTSESNVRIWGTETSDWDNFNFDDLVDLWVEPDTTLMDNLGVETAWSGFGTESDLNELLHSWDLGCNSTDIGLHLPFPNEKFIDPPEAVPVPMPIISNADTDQPAIFASDMNATSLWHTDDLKGLLSA